jgi:hypothetical protein
MKYSDLISKLEVAKNLTSEVDPEVEVDARCLSRTLDFQVQVQITPGSERRIKIFVDDE